MPIMLCIVYYEHNIVHIKLYSYRSWAQSCDDFFILSIFIHEKWYKRLIGINLLNCPQGGLGMRNSSHVSYSLCIGVRWAPCDSSCGCWATHLRPHIAHGPIHLSPLLSEASSFVYHFHFMGHHNGLQAALDPSPGDARMLLLLPETVYLKRWIY